jgi:hypothetical protein
MAQCALNLHAIQRVNAESRGAWALLPASSLRGFAATYNEADKSVHAPFDPPTHPQPAHSEKYDSQPQPLAQPDQREHHGVKPARKAKAHIGRFRNV